MPEAAIFEKTPGVLKLPKFLLLSVPNHEGYVVSNSGPFAASAMGTEQENGAGTEENHKKKQDQCPAAQQYHKI